MSLFHPRWEGAQGVAAGGLLDGALDDANEAEAVGTDVGSKAVAEGERETMWRNA